ncbi:MAG: nucleotidyltransferase family protein, partial [Oscillospiraceae bacterium]|nr:nucleotidyltransferase family protein [Oscillospiraceae bacterium]
MTEKSRTEYSARNATIAMISQASAILMGYLTRIVFTHTLSESYVGINGLFMDILNVLALSQLGVGAALTYALYKPIAEGNIEKQKSLMQLFKWLYRIMALLIAVAGLLVVPFLGHLVRDANDVDHIIPIYLLYLLNTVVSYLIVYKKNLIDAHQLSYIGVLCQTIFLIIQYVGQIVILLYTHNFVLFLLIYLLCTLGNNLTIAKKADSMYPYLLDEDVEPLPKAEKRDIIKNIRAMLMHKVGNVVVNNTDNVLISAMVGVISVGKYSNYYLIIGSVRQVLEQIFLGITASVGNFGVTEDRKRVKNIFEVAFFIGQWLCGFAAIGLFQLLNSVVSFSFGEQYVFPTPLVFVLCLNFFVTGMRQATLVFRDSLGLFWYDRYKSLVEAAINLVVSILLTLRFGIIGVFLGTFISTMLTSFWIEPYVLYKKRLECSVAPYFVLYAKYTAGVVIAGILTNVICRNISGAGILAIIVRIMLCVIIPNVFFLLCYHRTKEFRFLFEKAVGLLKKKQLHEEDDKPLDPIDEELLSLTKSAMTGEKYAPCHDLSDSDWCKILNKADRHAIMPIIYDTLTGLKLTTQQQESVDKTSRKCVVQNYHLLYLTHKVIETLKEKGVSAIVLKGVSAACYYPTPELRKSGDVDILLLHEEQLDAARDTLLKIGFKVTEVQPSLHHL